MDILYFLGAFVVVALFMFVVHKLRPNIKELSPFGTIAGGNYATVVFTRSFKIKQIDGNPVNLKIGSAKAGSLKILPGSHTFVFNFSEGDTSGTGLTATGDLESGKKYLMKTELTDNPEKLKLRERLSGITGKVFQYTEFVECCNEEDLKHYLSFTGGAT